MAPDPGKAANDRLAPLRLERRKAAAVDQSGDDLGCVERDAVIGADDAVELPFVLAGRGGLGPVDPLLALMDRALVGGLADFPQLAVCLVLGGHHVVADARNLGVECRSPKLVGVDDLTQRGLDDRGATEEDSADALDHDHLIAESRHVGAAGGAATEDHAQLGQALRRKPGLTIERATEMVLVGEDLILQREESTAGIDQVDDPELVLLGDLLSPNVFLDGHRNQRAALDGGVVCDEHPGHAVHDADPGHDAGPRHLVVVLAEAGQGRQFEKRRSLVGDHVDPFAGQVLAPRQVTLDRLLTSGPAVDRGLLTFLERLEQAGIGLGVDGERLRPGIDPGGDAVHTVLPAVWSAVWSAAVPAVWSAVCSAAVPTPSRN